MSSATEPAETILVVDDEEPVRRTFGDWLQSARLGCRVLMAADAAEALVLADRHAVDLAILDWNLGAGQDGLSLLEDLTAFNPDVVAIMITGYANQATPLMAMRMGVRDYLDKNQNLDRETFLAAVVRQLERIRPAKRERRLHQGLTAFRAAVEQVLPVVQAAAALQDPVPLPTAIRSLFAFLTRSTRAGDGVLVVHVHDAAHPVDAGRAYDVQGRPVEATVVPVARSLAGWVLGMQEPVILDEPDKLSADGSVELQPFEKGRRQILAAPIPVAAGLQVVLELFDRTGGPFGEADRELLRAASEFGGDLLRQALAERQTHRLLLDAVAAALRAGDEVAQTLRPLTPEAGERLAEEGVLEQLETGLRAVESDGLDAAATVRLAESIRALAQRYGPVAAEHCCRLVDDLGRLLDNVSGAGGEKR